MTTTLPTLQEILRLHGTKLQSTRIYPDIFPLYPTDLVLNLGCGKATQVIPYKGRFKRMCGLDVDFTRLRLAAETCTVLELGDWASYCADAHSLPLQSGIFDACMAIDVIEHVLRPSDVLSEVYRVLKPGGRLLITFIAMYDAWIHLFATLQRIGLFRKYNLNANYILFLSDGRPNPGAHHHQKPVAEWIDITANCGFRLGKSVASTLVPPLHRIGIRKFQYTNDLIYRVDRFLSSLPIVNRLGQSSVCVFEKI